MDLPVINITVCNSRCWPNPVVFIVTSKSEWEFTYLNFALQRLMAKKLMFKCANYLQGRRLIGATATAFFESIPQSEEHFRAIDFLTKQSRIAASE